MNVSTLTFINETEYESDPFAAVPDEVLLGTYPIVVNAMGYYVTAITILKLILVLAVIVANVFLAIMILRFRKLKAIRTNVYLLNISILNIIYYLCSPLFYIICHLFSAYEASSIMILQTQSTLLTLYTTFALGMGMDWFLTGCKPQIMKKFEISYKFVFIGIYILFFIEWAVAFIYSEVEHVARAATFTVFFVIYSIILTIMNILKRRMNLRSESKQTEYAFTITNIIIYSFMPIFIFHLLFMISSYDVARVLLFLEIIPEIVEIGHPILVVYMVGRLNKYFKMAYNKSFKRSVREYEDDDLDAISVEDFSRNILDININATQEEVLHN